MRNILLPLFVLLGHLALYGQTIEPVVSSFSSPSAVVLDDTIMYVSQYTTSGGIFTVKLNDPLPTTVSPLLSGLLRPNDMELIGDSLYITQDRRDGAFVRIDPTDANPTLDTLAVGIPEFQASLVRSGNDLYISTVGSFSNPVVPGAGIFKLDLSAPFPQTPTPIITNNPAKGMAIIGNDLYFGSYQGPVLQKIDISQPNPVPDTVLDGLGGPAGLVFDGNFLYISQYVDNNIIRIDVTQPNPDIDTILTGLSRPTELAFDGLDIYFGELFGGRISRITVNQVAMSTLPKVCIGNMPTDLGGATPSGGVYSGNFVTDNGDGQTFTFDAMASGVGTFEVVYSFGTAESDTAIIEVIDLPTVSLATPDTLSIAGGDSVLGGGMPTGGVYSGPGVTDGGDGETYTYSPGTNGEGVYAVTYTYTDSLGCENTAEDSIEVVQFLASVESIVFAPLKIAPNPTTGFVSIMGIQAEQVLVLDITGREMPATRLSHDRIDLSSLPKGIYTLKIAYKNQWATRRVIKD